MDLVYIWGGAITGLTPPCLYSVTLPCLYNKPHVM